MNGEGRDAKLLRLSWGRYLNNYLEGLRKTSKCKFCEFETRTSREEIGISKNRSSAFGKFNLLVLRIGQRLCKCNCPLDNADRAENMAQGAFLSLTEHCSFIAEKAFIHR